MLLQDKPGECILFAPVTLNELFQELDAAGQAAFRSIESGRSIPSNSVIFSPGDYPLDLYVYVSGHAALVSRDGAENSVLACPVSSNRIYGLVEALSGTAFQTGLRTVTTSEFKVIDQESFLKFVRCRPELCYRLAEILCHYYQQALISIRSN